MFLSLHHLILFFLLIIWFPGSPKKFVLEKTHINYLNQMTWFATFYLLNVFLKKLKPILKNI
jgi:hypothetical protein